MNAVLSSDVIEADVIIAGAGLTGATLGLALARAGLTPVLVDPQRFEAQIAPTFDGRASAIAFSSFRQWRALGLRETLAPQAQRIEQILVTEGRGPGAAGRPRRPGHPALPALRRRRDRRALGGRAAGLHGGEPRQPRGAGRGGGPRRAAGA